MADSKLRMYQLKRFKSFAIENAAQDLKIEENTPIEILRKNKSETRIRQQIFNIIEKGLNEGLSKEIIIENLRKRPGAKQFEKYFEIWIKQREKTRQDEER